MSRFLDELYFLMTEFHNFETEFKTQLSQNYISSNTACLVDAEEVENWKASVAYDESLEYLENNDKINFDKKQFELRKGTINRNKINFRSYKTLEEVCNSLKHNKRISIVGHQFFCYIDSMTYTPKVFEYYTKNNQLLIYFGEGKWLELVRNAVIDKMHFLVDGEAIKKHASNSEPTIPPTQLHI